MKTLVATTILSLLLVVGCSAKDGSPGTPGYSGNNGTQGDPGQPGVKGDTGPTGPVGPQGPQGVKGDLGAPGDAGTQGPAGATGPKGDTGAAGPQGPQGLPGATGPQGIQGIAGAKGATGATGPASSFDMTKLYYVTKDDQTQIGTDGSVVMISACNAGDVVISGGCNYNSYGASGTSVAFSMPGKSAPALLLPDQWVCQINGYKGNVLVVGIRSLCLIHN